MLLSMKHRLCIAFLTIGTLFAVNVLPAYSQYVNKPSDIWLKHMPGMEKKDRKAAECDLNNSDGPVLSRVTNPTLEAFMPVDGTSNGHAVIVCPGGAYKSLSYQKEGQEVAQWLARQGFNAYVLAYRVPDNREGALQDLQRAIRVLRHLGAKDVGVIGFSAGASLSCRAATNWKEPAYQVVDKNIDTLSCRPDFAMLIYPAYLNEGEGGTLSPDLHVDGDTPPMFVFGSQDDVWYSGPSCKTILKAMQEAKAPIQLHYLNKAGHGYGMRRGAGLVWPGLAELWLKEK